MCGTLQELIDQGLDTQAGNCQKCNRDECTVGNPTLPGSGHKVLEVVDYSTNGPLALAVRRQHTGHTRAHAYLPVFGEGWRLSFETHMSKTSTVIDVQLANGNYYSFTKQKDGSWLNTLNTSANVRLTAFTTPVEAYEIADDEDTVQRFESVASAFRIVSITTRNGYQQTINRDGTGRITGVTDSFGRSLTFTWTSDVLTRISAPGSVDIDYTYQTEVDHLSNPLTETRTIKTVTVAATGGGSPETTTYHYENTNWPYALTGITDARGVRFATYTYDDVSGRVATTEHDGGVEKHAFSYPSATQTVVVNPLGKSATYNYTVINSAKRLTKLDGAASANCVASNSTMAYNALGRLTDTTDEEGRVTKRVLDARGLPTSITRGYGTAEAVTTTFTNHSTLNVATQMVEPGLTTDYTWTSGQLTALTQTDTTSHSVPYSTNGQTRTWAFTYGTGGTLLTVDGPLAGTGDKTTYTYDGSGYLATVTNPVGHVTTINTVNGRGQPTKITDANSIVTEMTYDTQGRLKTVTVDPGGGKAVTAMDYDAIGQITKITRPDGSSLAYTYNNARQLTEVTQDDGQKIEYTRDKMGGVTSHVIKTSGGTIVFNQTQTFDELGRLLKHIGASSQTTTHAYEKNNNLKSVTDPRSGLYSYAYDAVNRLIRETDQESMQVNYTLDGQGLVTGYSDPRSLATTYVRNGFGDVIRRTSPDSGITDYVLDARGLVTQLTDARGVVTNMTYDDAGRMLTRTFPAATAENITYTYDSTAGGNKGVGRLTQLQSQNATIAFFYDPRGNVTQETRTIDGKAHTTAYAYDLADRVTQITYPSGRIVDYARDSSSRITGVTTKASAMASPETVASSIAYMPLSRLVQAFTYGNGLTEANTWNLDYEIGRCEVKDGVLPVIDTTYARGDQLNLTGITDAVISANSQSLAYSAANRLNSASGAYGAMSWTYDGVGNRTQEISTPVGGPTTTRTYTYPGSSNRMSKITIGGVTERDFTYDAAGNTDSDSGSGTLYYSFNARNRLETVKVGASLRGTYTYNGLEQLAIRVLTNMTPSGTTHFIHDRWGNVIAETDGSGAAGTIKEYIWLPEAEIAPTFASRAQIDRPLAVVDQVSTSPVLYWVHVDQLSRPIKMTDGTKAQVWDAVWAPWGAPHAITGPATLDARFPGQWFQLESGLHYNWHRHYDPTLGRYTQPDPLGFVDGPSIYGYAKGSPHAHLDPSGEFVVNPVTIELGRQIIIAAARWVLARTVADLLRGAEPIPVPVPTPVPPGPTSDPTRREPPFCPKDPEKCNKMGEKERPDGGRQCIYYCPKSGQTRVIYTTPERPVCRNWIVNFP